MKLSNFEKNKRRQKRTRAKISGTAERPRLNVSRSNRYLYLQLIDDVNGLTLAAVHSKSLKTNGNKTEVSFEAGKILAQKATEKKISEVVFDRGAKKYHGRVKSVADGARDGGLKF